MRTHGPEPHPTDATQNAKSSCLAYIDALVGCDRSALRGQTLWLLGIGTLGFAFLVVNVATGWIRSLGPDLGNGLVFAAAGFPIMEMSKCGGRVKVLEALRANVLNTLPGSGEIRELRQIVLDVVKARAGG
jgi:hypothetical protein